MLDPTVIDPRMGDPRKGEPRKGEPRLRPLLRTKLGDVLRRTRLGQGRTLADVARAAKVSMPYLSEVERGRKEVSSEVLAAICDALGIELSDLMTEVGRDLADFRGRRAPVVRLEAIRGRRDSPLTPDSLAPGSPLAPGTSQAAGTWQAPGASQARSSADAQCLLAA